MPVFLRRRQGLRHSNLFDEAKFARCGRDFSLGLRLAAEGRERTLKRLLCPIDLAEHDARSHEIDPAFDVLRRLFETNRKPFDHAANHGVPVRRCQSLRGAHLFCTGPFANGGSVLWRTGEGP